MRRVTLTDEEGCTEFEGKVDSSGMRQGRGTTYEDGLAISGVFRDDELEGSCTLRFDDGTWAEATMERGEVSGRYQLHCP